jgi:glutamine synthetase type III
MARAITPVKNGTQLEEIIQRRGWKSESKSKAPKPLKSMKEILEVRMDTTDKNRTVLEAIVPGSFLIRRDQE